MLAYIRTAYKTEDSTAQGRHGFCGDRFQHECRGTEADELDEPDENIFAFTLSCFFFSSGLGFPSQHRN
jgi:hypothetical protein